MRSLCILAKIITGLIILTMAGTPVGATTLRRAGLEELIADNEIVVHAKVVDSHSYWNIDRSFILTDLRLQLMRSFKGVPGGNHIVITLTGGTVGELTSLIIGGPNLLPGSEYVLFLSRLDLPGAPARLTVRDLAQGVFGIVDDATGRRAVSQANHLWLVADAAGNHVPPGGTNGLFLEELSQMLRTLTNDR